MPLTWCENPDHSDHMDHMGFVEPEPRPQAGGPSPRRCCRILVDRMLVGIGAGLGLGLDSNVIDSDQLR
jgi:hypothetical protein